MSAKLPALVPIGNSSATPKKASVTKKNNVGNAKIGAPVQVVDKKPLTANSKPKSASSAGGQTKTVVVAHGAGSSPSTMPAPPAPQAPPSTPAPASTTTTATGENSGETTTMTLPTNPALVSSVHVGNSLSTAGQRGFGFSDFKNLMMGCSIPRKEECRTTVRTVSVVRKACPEKIPVVTHCALPAPKPLCVVPPPVCVPAPVCPPKPCKKVCPPTEVVQVVDVEQKIPENPAVTNVKTVYASTCDPNPCVVEAIQKTKNNFDPTVALLHAEKNKPFDHCKMPLGDQFGIRGQGTLCSKELIFDIAGGQEYLQKVLGDSVETANSRQTEATNFFMGAFGVDFHDVVPSSDGVFRTKEADMFPYRISSEIRTTISLCTDGMQSKQQVRVFKGGFAVRIKCPMRAAGQYAANEGGNAYYTENMYLFYGIIKLQKYEEVQVDAAINDPNDPCNPAQHVETSWIAKGEPCYIEYTSEKPATLIELTREITIRAALTTGSSNGNAKVMRGNSTMVITWEPTCEKQVNVVVREMWEFMKEYPVDNISDWQ